MHMVKWVKWMGIADRSLQFVFLVVGVDDDDAAAAGEHTTHDQLCNVCII